MTDALAITIGGLGAQGDGLALTTDRECHIPGALPGEKVRRQADGGFSIVGPPSPDRRATPLCSHVPRCGGCTVQHMGDTLYRDWKSALLAAALSQRGLACPISPMRSMARRSRRRASFTGVWVDGRPALGFRGRDTHDLEPIADCAVLRTPIVAALPQLAQLAAVVVPKGKPFRLAVLAADNGLDIAIDQRLAPAADRAMATVAQLMRAAGAIRLTCNNRLVLQMAEPIVLIADVAVSPGPGAFLQATSETDALLADLVIEGLGKARHVLDLFCGVGTLSWALARRARVTAVDADASLLATLEKARNGARGLKPIQPVRRDLFRDPLSPRELEKADAIVLDPPRAGATAQCQSIARSKVRRVVMVSCNPATLGRDLRLLVDGGYRLETAAPIDQFLFTHHLEVVAVLSRD
ncbi:MAG: class I SAM-dependent RNA methyltransferase [Hyphomicrobiaceae bacterium]